MIGSNLIQTIDDGMYHLVGEVIVKHIDGTYLIMQRDFKKHYGGMWELTAGGSALLGETPLECAVRELREETVNYKWVDKKSLLEMSRDELVSSRTMKLMKELDI